MPATTRIGGDASASKSSADGPAEPANKLRRVMTGLSRQVSDLSGKAGSKAEPATMRVEGGVEEDSDEDEEEEDEYVDATNGGFEQAREQHEKEKEKELQDASAMAERLRGKSIYGMKRAAFGSSVRRDAPVDHAKRVDERRRVLRQSVRQRSGSSEEGRLGDGAAAAGGVEGTGEQQRLAARRRRRQRAGMDPSKLAAAQSAVDAARGVASGLASRPPRAGAGAPQSQGAAPPAPVSAQVDLSDMVGDIPLHPEDEVGAESGPG